METIFRVLGRATAFTLRKERGKVRGMEIKELAEGLGKITDPRRAWGNKRHKLEDILVMGLCTIVCGGEDFTDMENFGQERESWLRGFLELPNGIPDADTFRRVFERVDPQELSEVLRDWIGNWRQNGAVVSIDGKTIRGSGNSRHKAYHVVSAFVSENHITLGELKTEEKSNEITAVPELLDLLDIKNCIVTADAMSCQRAIAHKVREKGAEYVLSVKENQPNLLESIRDYFSAFTHDCRFEQTVEKNHGRIEKRKYFLETDLDWFEERVGWNGLHGIGAVCSRVEEKGQTRTETRYYITSLRDVSSFAYAVRGHWGIENNLHWCLDVAFGEDSSRARKDNSPLNLNVLRKTALPMLKNADLGRMGLKKKMFRAALSTDTLSFILNPQPLKK